MNDGTGTGQEMNMNATNAAAIIAEAGERAQADAAARSPGDVPRVGRSSGSRATR